jgi:ATP-dependent DNA ligase
VDRDAAQPRRQRAHRRERIGQHTAAERFDALGARAAENIRQTPLAERKAALWQALEIISSINAQNQ